MIMPVPAASSWPSAVSLATEVLMSTIAGMAALAIAAVD
jgi:hypothetical protein